MINLSLLGKLLILLGVVVSGISVIQWFFRFPDTSQLSLGVGIGICFASFGYIHSWMRNKDERMEGFDQALDAMRVYQVDEIEKLNKKIKDD